MQSGILQVRQSRFVAQLIRTDRVLNGSGTSQNANCVTCTSSGCGPVGTGTPAPTSDPEAPSFVLNQIDITYSFNPLIPGKIFNIPLQAFSGICSSGTCGFTRRARMRAMN